MRLAYVTVAVLVLSIASVEAAAQSTSPVATSPQDVVNKSADDIYTVVKEVPGSKTTWTVIYSGHPVIRIGEYNYPGSPKLRYTLQFSDGCHFKSPEEYDCDHPLTVGQTFGHLDIQPTGKITGGSMVDVNDGIGEISIREFKENGRDISHFYKVLRVEVVKDALKSDAQSAPSAQPTKPTFDPNAPYSVIPPPVQPARQAKQQSPSRLAPSRKDIPTIAKAANGAIVTIVMANDDKPFALGSGFLVSPEGVIVTNYHVIAEGNVAIVKFPDGTALPVDGVLAADKVRDLAVIKIHGKSFRTLVLGNSDQVRVGEEVVAIGNPLGLELTVSNGILSGVRTVEKEGGKFLQVTAPISHGSSGGPLFNMHGEVVGINTMSYEGGENLNFAIPVNDAKILLSNQSTKLQNLPNETEPVKAQTQSGDAPPSVSVPSPQTTPGARDYYQQLYNAGGFSNGLPNAVCFSDDAHSGSFFTFVAYAYDKDYYDAQAKLPTFEQAQTAGYPGVTPEQMTQFKIMERVQRTAPYVSFLMKGWFETFPREAQQFFRSGGRVLDETIYEKGVKVNTIEYRWDGSSWYFSIPPADPNAYTKTLKILRLAIEPTSMRYVDSTTVTMTVGSGATAATHTDRYGPWGGVCEKVPNPK